MNEELYIEIKERLEDELGREPTEDEITGEYANLCDFYYEGQKYSDFVGRNGDG